MAKTVFGMPGVGNLKPGGGETGKPGGATGSPQGGGGGMTPGGDRAKAPPVKTPAKPKTAPAPAVKSPPPKPVTGAKPSPAAPPMAKPKTPAMAKPIGGGPSSAPPAKAAAPGGAARTMFGMPAMKLPDPGQKSPLSSEPLGSKPTPPPTGTAVSEAVPAEPAEKKNVAYQPTMLGMGAVDEQAEGGQSGSTAQVAAPDLDNLAAFDGSTESSDDGDVAAEIGIGGADTQPPDVDDMVDDYSSIPAGLSSSPAAVNEKRKVPFLIAVAVIMILLTAIFSWLSSPPSVTVTLPDGVQLPEGVQMQIPTAPGNIESVPLKVPPPPPPQGTPPAVPSVPTKPNP